MNTTPAKPPVQALTEARAWQALDAVLDPEVPVLSVVELGIVREVQVDQDRVRVVLTPTYSGCPATEVIEAAVVDALKDAGATTVQVQTRLAPPWTTDWLAPQAAEKLRRYGIAPPQSRADGCAAGGGPAERPLHFHPRELPCPRCGSTHTEQLSAFGATACKSLYRCRDCGEPFEYFKPH